MAEKKKAFETRFNDVDVSVENDGTKIVLPALPHKMTEDEAIIALQVAKAKKLQKYDITETVSGVPWDAAVAVYRALAKKYGVISPQSIRTWFGDILPTFITVETGPKRDDRLQIPIGVYTIPNFKNNINVQLSPTGVVINGTVTLEERKELSGIVEDAREILRTDSIYKGKAIVFDVNDKNELDLTKQPRFMDMDGVKESDAIYTEETTSAIETNIFSPIRNTAHCRTHKVPLKRGILLGGTYGVGKTLTALVTAKVATDNGWSFMSISRSKGLKAALEFSRSYQPCVLFAEDVDRVGDRQNEAVNDLINLMDGIETKRSEVIVVLTTNHIERIDKALLRPGRFDALIQIQAPDADTVGRLIRAFAGKLLPAGEDLAEVGAVIAGQVPAIVREVVDKSKLAMFTRGSSKLSAGDLLTAARTMRRQMDLLQDDKKEPTPAEQLYEGTVSAIKDAVERDDVDVAAETTLKTVEELSTKIAKAVRAIA